MTAKVDSDAGAWWFRKRARTECGTSPAWQHV